MATSKNAKRINEINRKALQSGYGTTKIKQSPKGFKTYSEWEDQLPEGEEEPSCWNEERIKSIEDKLDAKTMWLADGINKVWIGMIKAKEDINKLGNLINRIVDQQSRILKMISMINKRKVDKKRKA